MFRPRQQSRLARLAQRSGKARDERVTQRQPHRREHRLFALRSLSAAYDRQVVMVMLRILRRRIVVVVVIIISIPSERMMHAAIRNPAMSQRHMPGGKEPAEQKQKCDESFVCAHGATYGGVGFILSTHHASSSGANRRLRRRKCKRLMW